MNQYDFVRYFDEQDFPSTTGRWLSEECYDPPFKESELKPMEKAGLIEREPGRFRLTLKATKVRNGVHNKRAS